MVELSFDGGTNWGIIEGIQARALDDDSAIVFDCPDLTKIYPAKNPDEDPLDETDQAGSFWDALLRGQGRVRVTCVIEGDKRIEPNVQAAGFAAAIDDSSKVINPGKRFYSQLRDGGNSQFRSAEAGGSKPAPSVVVGSGDRLDVLQKYAEELYEACSTRQMPGVVTIPWVSTEYPVGTSLTEIEGLGFEFFVGRGQDHRRAIDVVGVEYVDAMTRLVMEDFRALDRLAHDTEKDKETVGSKIEGLDLG